MISSTDLYDSPFNRLLYSFTIWSFVYKATRAEKTSLELIYKHSFMVASYSTPLAVISPIIAHPIFIIRQTLLLGCQSSTYPLRDALVILLNTNVHKGEIEVEME